MFMISNSSVSKILVQLGAYILKINHRSIDLNPFFWFLYNWLRQIIELDSNLVIS